MSRADGIRSYLATHPLESALRTAAAAALHARADDPIAYLAAHFATLNTKSGAADADAERERLLAELSTAREQLAQMAQHQLHRRCSAEQIEHLRCM